MKLLQITTLSTILTLLFSGCALRAPSKDTPVDDSLPVITMTQNGVIADINSIALEWQSISDPRVEGIYVYKIDMQKSDSNKDDYFDTINDRFSTHYLDTKVEPDKKYSYYFKTYSQKAISRSSSPVTTKTLPPMEPVSWIHATGGMPRSVKILWRPHPNEKIKAYAIERKTLESDKWEKIATIQGRLSAEYVDSKLKDNYTYIYRVKALSFDGLYSLPSAEVSVITKELPSEVAQINASSDLPRAIKIEWNHNQDNGFLTYRVYRSSSLNGNYEMLGDTKERVFIDKINEDGKEYFYRISVFDKDKLESVNSNFTVMGKTLSKPIAPSITEARIVDGKVKLAWISTDPRNKSFIVEKKHKKNLFDSKITEIANIKSNEFYDSYIQNDQTYIYKVYGIDDNKIKSEPSIEVEIKVKNVTLNRSLAPASNNSTMTVEQKSTPSQPTSNDSFRVNEPVEEVVIPLNDFK